uniref:Uncharacterized protein n=1 Tax=Entomoneis paludosa TaxID=265537 RepID=A0A7S2YFC5_9STRA
MTVSHEGRAGQNQPGLRLSFRMLHIALFLQIGLFSTNAFSVLPHRPEISTKQQNSLPSSDVFFRATSSHSTRFNHRFFGLQAKPSAGDDIPEEWGEDDILAEFEELEGASSAAEASEDDDEDEDDETAVVYEDDDSLVNEEDEDDDEDLDDIDLDDDEEFELNEEHITTLPRDWEGEYEPAEAYNNLDWDEEEDGGDYELEDDPKDPNYMKQKELVEATVKASEQRMRDEAFDPLHFIMNDMTEDQADIIEKLPFMKDIEAKAQAMMLGESDVDDVDLETAVVGASDFTRDDEYPRDGSEETKFFQASMGAVDDDLEEFDRTYKDLRDQLDEEPWDKVLLREQEGIENLSNETLDEMEACLEELGGSAYNVTRWLLYDLDFNVSNLMLAAIKHNPEAPVLFHHWYPQIVTYSRYEDVRSRDFDFSWEDVENADMEELERYYAGFGYTEIPQKAPAETGVISFEDLDEEEIKMAAFENWISEVYNPEWDRKDFDDDDMQDTDNVFSDFFEPPQHPDKPVFEDAKEDLDDWNDDMDDDDPEVSEYRDRMGQYFNYKVIRDEEFTNDFRGHLVISCTSDDEDLEVAEKITRRFREEFGKKVWVETRHEALARAEDTVFEIWLESYEIDLLHSKKRANSSNKDWEGPAECDDAQIDYLVEKVRFLISDDARYSYRMEFEHVD